MRIKIEQAPTREWFAIDEDSYDGAPDARHMMGWGNTPNEALEDLQRLFEEQADYQQGMHEAECERRGICGFDGPADEFAGGGMCFGPKP